MTDDEVGMTSEELAEYLKTTKLDALDMQLKGDSRFEMDSQNRWTLNAKLRF